MGLYQWDCEFLTENDSLLLDDRKTSVEFQSENIGSMENDTVFKNRIFLVRSLPVNAKRPARQFQSTSATSTGTFFTEISCDRVDCSFLFLFLHAKNKRK